MTNGKLLLPLHLIMSTKVAIQGGKASFHDIASHRLFNNSLETVSCDSFKEVCEKLKKKEVNYAVMAIENSIAGSILPNYSLIEEYGFTIVGEEKLFLHQNLMVLPGQKLEDITRAMSHYMALLQCKEFFNKHSYIKLEEYHDTADAAKYIKENNLKGVGAIAGYMAAERYGLEIIAPDIETMKLNFTSFYVLSRTSKSPFDRSEANKTTLSFELPHEAGSLAKALNIINEFGISLTKIQSVPIAGKPDQYRFYIDCIWSDRAVAIKCLSELKHYCTAINVMGYYKGAEIKNDNFGGY